MFRCILTDYILFYKTIKFKFDRLKPTIMEVPKNHLEHIMLHEFNKGNSAAGAARNIHTVYGKKFMNKKTYRKWFAKFRIGNFTLEDEDRTKSPVDFDDKLLEPGFEENSLYQLSSLTALKSS